MSLPAQACKPDLQGRSAKERFADLRNVTLTVIAVAIAMRFLLLGRQSLWLDEAASVSIARLGWTEFVRLLWAREANMASFYLLLRPMLTWGDSEFWVRLIPAIAGLAALPVIYALGKRVFSARIGWLATMLLSVNACHVAYSHEARGYSMAVLFCALSSLVFLDAVEKPSVWKWLAYSLVSALAVYSHFFSGLALLAQWVSLVALSRRDVPWKYLCFGVSVSAVFATPAGIVALTHDVGQLDWLPKTNLLEVYHTAIFFAANGGKLPGNLLLALSLVALSTTAWRLWTRRETVCTFQRWKMVFLWCWLLIPVVVTVMLSLLGKQVFFHRFLIVCLPAFVLLLADGLAQLRRSGLWIGVFVLLSFGVVSIYGTRTREDWRGATSYVLKNALPGDGIFFCRDYGYTPYHYYEQRLRSDRGPVVVDPDQMNSQGSRPSRLWVVLYPFPSKDDVVSNASARLLDRFAIVQEVNFRGIRLVLLDTAHGK